MVLDAVRSTFPETNGVIDNTLKEESEKKNHNRWGNFCTSLEAKNYLEKRFLF